MSRTRLISLLSVVVASAAVALVPASASAAPAFYDGISADGSVAAFSTTEKMVPGDTDNEEDVYVRSFDKGLGEYITREVSLGPKGGNDTLPAHFDGISADGGEVFFSTREELVAGDTDHKQDVYVRDLNGNKTILASAGDPSCAAQSCGNGETDASFAFEGVPAEGGRVFFTTSEQLNSADKDSSLDVYVRDLEAGTTELVSAGDSSCTAGGCGNGTQAASFRGTDEAGDKAYFTTTESLAEGDVDAEESDIYERDLTAGRTYLVSVSGTCPSPLPPGQNCEPSFGGASPDGSHVFFETNERISGEDKDSSQDVYDWSGGTPALASIGPDGGNGSSIVTYAGTSGDGATVYFQTNEKLDATADTDSAEDVYQRSGGVTSLVSTGEGGKGNGGAIATFSWASTAPGPQVAVFRTGEALTAEDKDGVQDVYARSEGATTLVSIGPEGGNGAIDANFAGASADGSKIFFVTTESLVAQDKDSSLDIYLRSGETTTLVSAGQINGNGEFTAALHGVSADGSNAFFVTQERLTEGDDFAGEQDVYSWNDSGTRLISVKNSSELVLGPPSPTLKGTNPASPNPSTTPAIVGTAAQGALIKVYKTSTCSGEPVAQGTADELESPGLTVTVPVAAGSTTTYRATAEAEGVVSECSNAISYTQQEATPPPPGEEGGGGGGGGVSGGSGGGAPSGGGGGTSGGSGAVVRNGIVYVTPLPHITFGPAAKTRLRRPVFRFIDSAGQPNTRFFCRVDKQRWSKCTSPIKLKKLKLGKHVFSLKAVNAVGMPSASPVKRKFKVVR